jgi:hypothetical protein
VVEKPRFADSVNDDIYVYSELEMAVYLLAKKSEYKKPRKIATFRSSYTYDVLHLINYMVGFCLCCSSGMAQGSVDKEFSYFDEWH